jgi:hypothetical protein
MYDDIKCCNYNIQPNVFQVHCLVSRWRPPHNHCVRLMMGRGYRESCRDLFKEINILPLKSQYIYSLMMFVTEINLIQTRIIMK